MNIREQASGAFSMEVGGVKYASSIEERLTGNGIVAVSHYNGRTLFTNNTIEKNCYLLNGRIFLLEKGSGVRSGFSQSSLDEDLGISTSLEVKKDLVTLPLEKIIGFIVGFGGCGDSRKTILVSKSHEKHVPDWFPLRVTTERLSETERAKYILEKLNNGKYEYWGKRFENTPTIYVMYENGVEVPGNVFNMADPGVIKTYVRYNCFVNASECREYFLNTYGNTEDCRINSVGLVTGYDDTSGAEVITRNVRGMSILNMENKELADDASTVGLAYDFSLN